MLCCRQIWKDSVESSKMSGEYFVEDSTKLYQDYIEEKNQLSAKAIRKDDSQEKLQDIEDQIELAETRCNTLKGQLDYMKNLYGPATKHQKSRKYSNASVKRREGTNDSAISIDVHLENYGECRSESARQTTNDPTKDIHSIINGITNSVNRLSDLHLQIAETPKSKRGESARRNRFDLHADGSHVTNVEIKAAKMDNAPYYEQVPLEVNKSSHLTKKISKNIRKKHVSVPFDARVKKFPSSFAVPTKSASGTIYKKKSRSQNPPLTDNLVEIYHNQAAKETDSEHSGRGKFKRKSKTSRSEYISDIPPLSLNVPDDNQWNVRKVQPSKMDYSNIKTVNDAKNELRDSSYQLPTIASKMKQVAKCYFNAFNFKAIPFCPAASTSPSHNIGINLQQVMSMMKTKQPFQGLSPTLAHNIGLAAERLNSRPASMLVTTMTSRTATCSFLRTSSCPLSKNRMNYQHLQEMAKRIPEEDIIMEGEEETREVPAMKTTYITGPSGDMKIESKNDPVWAADADNLRKCTCVNLCGPDLNQMVNKFQISQPPNSAQSQVQRLPKYKSNLTKKKPRPIKMALVTKNNGVITNNNGNVVEEADETPQVPIHIKQKTLKGVLTNLHKEFDTMNGRYEELSKMGEAMNEENVKELQQLDVDLTAKEEEITMVMSLYKEVLALKQQVQTLKQKSSVASVGVAPKMADYNNPKAAFHLTKLLKQIQLYQSHYKKDLPVI
ncbi:unnamed protein product [Brassicogethes aeneus]|uniref:Cep57 centrosome localisation domain-containing protein n=1 Tax=Brassicogethes aeneus TaxID=1431903 RepID=A0A9P0ARH2_BRAAE|nr:unnamed protein product [Brassicogethes aeneus]